MKATLCIDDAVGETRRALLDPFGKPFRLEIERWSERGCRANLDEVWWGRVTARMPGLRGWFVDLGLDRAGVIEPTKAAVVIEGALLPLRIKSEAWSDKGPVLSLADMSPSSLAPDRPQRHATPSEDPFLRGVEVVARLTERVARRQIEAAIEEAGQRIVTLDGGGDLAIETTRGMTVIDVDSGERAGSANRDGFAQSLNLAAAEEAARQIGLRGLAGLVAIDFVSTDNRKHQKEIADAFRSSLAVWLGRSSEVLDLSALCVCEAAIARRSRPMRDALAASTAEREALDALREIESVGWASRGGRIRARVSRAAAAWLEAAAIAWKEPLANRIGERWTLEPEDRPAGRPQVWSL